MKLICGKPQLLEVINTVQRAISAKSSLNILECIKIEANSDGNVTFTGNNTEICIEYNTTCQVIEEGIIALESKMFGEIVRRLPEGDVTISVNSSNFVTKIKNGSSEFNIQGVAADEFPSAPVLDEEFSFNLTQSALKNIIRKTISFVAQSEGRKPILTGALFEIKNGCLNVAASDGHRLAVIKEELKENVENNKLVIPGVTLRELAKIVKDEEENVKIIVSERNVLFDFGYYQFYSRILSGDFLRYEAIISAMNTITVKAEKSLIQQSLERAILLINDDLSSKTENKVPVRFNIDYDKIEVSCVTARGQVNDTVPVEIEGGGITIGFNCRFLLDALSACDDDVIKMEFSAPTSGCFIKSVDGGDDYAYMILPVRLFN